MQILHKIQNYILVANLTLTTEYWTSVILILNSVANLPNQ